MAEKLTEYTGIVARIKPQTVSSGNSVESDVIDMRYFDEVLFDLNLGDYAGGNDGAITAIVYADTASGGSFTQAVSGASITGSLFTGSAGDDGMARIRVRARDVALLGDLYRYIKLVVTVSNQNLTLAAQAVATGAHFYNPADYDLAAVTEIVA